jgi:hypothetical protein
MLLVASADSLVDYWLVISSITMMTSQRYHCSFTADAINGTTTIHSMVSLPVAFCTRTDSPSADGVSMLSKLNITYAISEGYSPLRCDWTLGCPPSLTPWYKTGLGPLEYGPVWQAIFPETLNPPPDLAAPCCAQFAATRTAIHSRPLERWIAVRKWLLETPISDDTSGRVMEYAWHVLLGKEAMYCPNVRKCYCRKYGVCEKGMVCDGEDGTCIARWVKPPGLQIPEGWPERGFKGDLRAQGLVDEEVRKWGRVGKEGPFG